MWDSACKRGMSRQSRRERGDVAVAQCLPSKAIVVQRDHRLSYPTRPVGAFSSKQIRALCGNCPLRFCLADRAECT